MSYQIDYSPKSRIRYPECQNPECQNPECQNPECQNPECQNPESQYPETNIPNLISRIAKILKINFLNDQNPEIRKKRLQPPQRGKFGIFPIKWNSG